jgi:hypothetical protein
MRGTNLLLFFHQPNETRPMKFKNLRHSDNPERENKHADT